MDIKARNYLAFFAKLSLPTMLLLVSSLPMCGQDHDRPGARPEIQGKAAAQIPFQISSGLILVSLRIGESRDFRMYLDTGMSAPVVAFFHKEIVQEMRLKNTQQVLLGGAGGQGQKPGQMARGITIMIGNLELPNQTLIIMNDRRDASPWQVDGIVGRSIFDSYLAQIDYETSAITLYDRAGARIKSPMAAAVPINLDLSGIPTIEAKINIDGREEKTVKLVLDLGHRNALFLNVSKGKGILLPEQTIAGIAGRGIQGEVHARIGRIRELKLRNFSLRDVPTSFLGEEANMGLNRELVDGDLGQSILRRFHIVLDYGNKRMFLTPNKYFHNPFELDMAGFAFLEQDGEGAVYAPYVMENSPAAENDIRKGDKIVKIDGVDAGKYGYYQLHDLLRQEGKLIRLTIERGQEWIEKTLTLRRLI